MSKINIKKYAKDVINIAPEYKYLRHEDYNGTTFMYIKDPLNIYLNNAMIIATYQINKNKFIPKTYYIVIDDIFEKIPVQYQRFMIEHEKAHCILGHLEFEDEYAPLKRLLPNSKEEIMEYEADVRAARNTSKDLAIGALTWMIDNISLPLLSKVEIKRRIRRLEKCHG